MFNIYIGTAVLAVIFLIGWFLVKKIKININELVSYTLAVVCVVLAADRLMELFRVLLTGELSSYWTPIGYTLALFACVAGYCIMCSSPMCVTLRHPMHFFVFFSLCFYGIVLGMLAQWSNELIWFGLMHLSNFRYIATNMPEVIAPAVAGLSLIIPLSTVRSRWNYYIGNVVDGDTDWIESFEDFKRIQIRMEKEKGCTTSSFSMQCTYLCR